MSVDTAPTKAFAAMAAAPHPAPAPFDPIEDELDLTPVDPVTDEGHRALTPTRITAAVALLTVAALHLRGAWSQGLGGPLLTQSQLVLLVALPSAVVGLGLLVRGGRLWPVAAVLAGLDLAAILASVYLPVPALGPFPGLDEPVWWLTKAASGLGDLTVLTLWLIRQVAPAQE